MYIFFFSSRRRHTRCSRDWSSDVCSSDLTIEHGIWLDGDAIEMMLDGGNALIPTLVAPHWVIRHAEAGKMPAYAIDKARAVIDDHKASIRQAIESGVKIAFGTDTGVGPHGSNGEEFLLMRDLGMEPIDCIRSATTVAGNKIAMKGVGRREAGAVGSLLGGPRTPVVGRCASRAT